MTYLGMPGVKREYRASLPHVITLEKIIKVVCKYYNLSLKELEMKDRHRDKVRARHVIFYFIRKFTNMSLKDTAGIFFMDHTTVIHGLQKLKDLMDVELELKAQVDLLEQQIKEQYPV